MGVWLRDGFEFYNAISDASLGAGYGVWDSGFAGSNVGFSKTTRFGLGRSLQGPQNPGFTTQDIAAKGGFSNQATVLFGCAVLFNGTLGAATNALGFALRDGATQQCVVVFSADGAIRLKTGGVNGTTIATFAGAFLGNQWNQFQFKIVIDPTVGEFHVRKNGNTADDFSATGLNTRGGTANSYANSFYIGNGNGAADSFFVDDLAVWDTTGSAPWNDWVGDFRAVAMYPNADTSIQWNQNNSQSTIAGPNTQSGGNTLSVSANTTTTTTQVFPQVGGTFTTMDVNFNAGFTGNAKVAVYDSNGDTSATPTTEKVPGTLIATSNAVVNPTSGVNAFTFASAVTLLNGHGYFFALLTDTNCVVKAAASTLCWSGAQTYGSGFANPFGGSPSSFNQPLIYVPALTVTNSGCVNDEVEDGTNTYISSGTVGNKDLYAVSGLPVTPASVLGVDVIAMVSKSDAGTRQVQIALKSGATENDYTAITPNTTLNYYKYQQDTDPNTSAAWTPTNLNNVQVGAKVSA